MKTKSEWADAYMKMLGMADDQIAQARENEPEHVKQSEDIFGEIQADALRHAAGILFDDHWNDNDITNGHTHIINEARKLEAVAEPSNGPS